MQTIISSFHLGSPGNLDGLSLLYLYYSMQKVGVLGVVLAELKMGPTF